MAITSKSFKLFLVLQLKNVLTFGILALALKTIRRVITKQKLLRLIATKRKRDIET